jgi:23S rRNA (guanosine2251-2'-O)-methyltransferase
MPSSRGLIAIIESVETKDSGSVTGTTRLQVCENRILLVDEVNDPQNVGAMLRSCVCFGFHAAILTDRNTAPISDGVVNSSSGKLLSHPYLQSNQSVQSVLKFYRKKDFWMVGTSLRSRSMVG